MTRSLVSKYSQQRDCVGSAEYISILTAALTVTLEKVLRPPHHGVSLPVPDTGHHLPRQPLLPGHLGAGAVVDDAVPQSPPPVSKLITSEKMVDWMLPVGPVNVHTHKGLRSILAAAPLWKIQLKNVKYEM